MNKVLTEAELSGKLAELRAQGKTVATYNGSFDLLHIGHVRSIEEAANQADVLVLLVNSDASVKQYKGPSRPIVPEIQRADMLAALEVVTYVVLFDDLNPKRLLAELKPDVHCSGSDWGADCLEKDVVEAAGGRIHVLEWEPGYSTTALLDKINIAQSAPNVKAIFLDRDGTINADKEGYTYKIEDFEFLPGVIEALQAMAKTDYKLIVVTNQSGIGRGYYTEDDLQKLNQWLVAELAKKGVELTAIYHCPHLPDVGCDCRKPGVGMLLKAVEEHGINLSKSWLIGDSDSDIAAGREANLKTLKIGPGTQVPDLLAASKIVLKS